MYALPTFALAIADATVITSVGGGSNGAFGAFGLLAASLTVFIVSTRQWPLLQRALIWGFGVALLVVSVLASSDIGGGRFLKVLTALSVDNGLGSTIGSRALPGRWASEWTLLG
jgi:hypothetical protein